MAFEAYLTQDKAKPKKWRRLTYTLSLGLHGALLIVGVVYSFWHVEELSPPTVTVTFMSAVASPPPPPPPPKKRASTKPKPVVPSEIVQPRPDQVVQPREKEEPKEEPEEEDDGVEGGVEGGIAGGVVGGVVSAAPPPPDPPKNVPPNVGTGQLITNPQDAQYRPELPPAFRSAGSSIVVMLKICVSAEGGVADVKIMKGFDPTVDNIVKSKILSSWRYRPFTIDGRPVPFCYAVRYVQSTQL